MYEYEQFYNPYTLNIFSDASMLNEKHQSIGGCYGAVAVTEDRVIESVYKFAKGATNNNCEIKGLRSALRLANRYKDNYRVINIFGDSDISISGLTTYIHSWKYVPEEQMLYTKATNKPAANQEVFIEAFHLLDHMIKSGYNINIYHIKGHTDNSPNSIQKATITFCKLNNIPRGVKVDINLIAYLCTYNNLVDYRSRALLAAVDFNTQNYQDPISFFATGSID